MDTAYHTVPVQLTNGTLLQVLLGCCDIMALWQVVVHLLANPAARVNSRLGIGEPPLKVRHIACIGALLA